MHVSSSRRVLWWLFGAAFLLRLFGLSHDLHHGVVYHPDTPKQMRAVQQFLNDDYLVFQGHSDYDGYPYFNSHLVEYVVRSGMALVSAWRHWTGSWTAPVEPPDYLDYFLITRVWNALLSSLAVPLVFLIGLRFSRSVAWLASLFLVVSPLDITAAHFASNDSTVAFFCVAALWFGFRIAEQGRWRDLAGGAVCVAAAFSTKYHGAAAVAPVFLGHVLYCLNRREFVTRTALARWAWTGLVGVIALFLTSPAFIVNFDASLDAVRHFFAYTANFALPEELKQLPAYHRFWLGLRENLPVLADAVGLPVAAGFLLALPLVRRDRRLWLLASLPLLHVVVGLSGKPYLHQSHHTPITAYLFLGAVAGAWLWQHRLARRWTGVLLGVAGLWTAGHLATLTLKELLSFHASDTRRVAETWVMDSLPTGLQWVTDRYTVTPPPHDGPVLPVYAIVQSPDEPRVLPGFIAWSRFAFFDNRFSKFINRPVQFHTVANEHVLPPVSSPYLLAVPGRRHDDVVSLDAPWFGRSARVRDVSPFHPVRAWATTTQRLDRAWLVVQTGNQPVRMHLRFGGHEELLLLPSGRTRVITVEPPRQWRWPSDGTSYVAWCAEASWGVARVSLLTDPRHLALWAIEHEQVDVLREAAARVQGDDLVARLIRAVADGAPSDAARDTLRAELRRLLDEPSAWLAAFGMSETWLNRLPYRSWFTEDWVGRDEPEGMPTDHVLSLEMLSPGAYRLRLEGEGSLAGARYQITDTDSRVLFEGELDTSGEAAFTVRPPGDPLTLLLTDLPAPPTNTVVRPDPRGMVNRWIERLDAAIPSRGSPTEAVDPHATFFNEVTLEEYQLDTVRVAPGGELALRVRMWVREACHRPDRYAVWLHVVDDQGGIVAQHDRRLTYYLNQIHPDPREPAFWERIPLPPDLAPGAYEIRLGVWIPSQRTRSEVSDSRLEATDRHVVLGRIDVPARDAGATP